MLQIYLGFEYVHYLYPLHMHLHWRGSESITAYYLVRQYVVLFEE